MAVIILRILLLYQILSYFDPGVALFTAQRSTPTETFTTDKYTVTALADRGKSSRLLHGPTSHIDRGKLRNPPGTYPWEVSIGLVTFKRNKRSWGHYCGGVIASEFHVITSANCLEYMVHSEYVGCSVDDIYIRAGDHNLKVTKETQYIQEIKIEKYTPHPEFIITDYYENSGEAVEHYNNIAVIKLEKPLNFAEEYVRPIYLPKIEEASANITKAADTDVSLVTAGWGEWKSKDGKKIQNAGKALRDAVISSFVDSYCESVYNGTRLSNGFTDGIMCGASPLNLAGVCCADDGSGVFRLDHEKQRFVLTGILSLGTRWNYDKNCGDKSKPNIFVRVASHNIIHFLYEAIYGTETFDLTFEVPDNVMRLNVFQYNDDNCGINNNIEGKHNYVDETNKTGVWPWITSLRQLSEDDHSFYWRHICGATILSTTHILTAAHCVDEIQDIHDITVWAGVTNLNDEIDAEGIQVCGIKNIYLHPQYHHRHFDLAILELDKPLTFSKFVRQVCLLSLEEAMHITEVKEVYTPLVVSGWGGGRERISNKLEDTIATVFSQQTCNRTHPNKGSYMNLVPHGFSRETLCAGDISGDSGTCTGDSGGGAVYFDALRGRYILRAVISGSAYQDCGTLQHPNVYVRLSDENILWWLLKGIDMLSPESISLRGNSTSNLSVMSRHSGLRLATRLEVNNNYVSVMNQMGDWHIALLQDGSLFGTGYGAKIEDIDPTFLPGHEIVVLGEFDCIQKPPKTQIFSKDNFGKDPLRNTYCRFEMEARPGYRVYLTFISFSMNPSNKCLNDRIFVRDTNGSIIYKVCGNSRKSMSFQSSGNILAFELDSFKETSQFLAIWKEVEGNFGEQNQGKHLISFPHTLIENSEEQVCVDLLSTDNGRGSGEVTLKIFTNDDLFSGKTGPIYEDALSFSMDEDKKCKTVTLPYIPGPTKAFINFEAFFDNCSCGFNVFKEIQVLPKEIYILMQTDKGQYKPNDTVKFRILLLDDTLKPAQISNIDKIWVEDPHNGRIQQWRNKTLNRGILQEEFILSEESPLGTWSVNFQTGNLKEKTMFQVAEYVLPKFEVKIEPRSTIFRNSIDVTLDVCGTYTHGGSVKGIVRWNITTETIKQPIYSNSTMIGFRQDCAVIELNSFNLNYSPYLGKKGNSISLDVEFEEEGTGTKMVQSWTGSVLSEQIKLSGESSPTEFTVGGFPYIGRFKSSHHDGTPIIATLLEICWETNLGGLPHCKNGNTHEDGNYKFYIPSSSIPSNAQTMTIIARAMNYPADRSTGMNQPLNRIDVRLIKNKFGKSIMIENQRQHRIPCNNQFQANVYMSSTESEAFNLHYYIISKGKLFQTNKVEVDPIRDNQINFKDLIDGINRHDHDNINNEMMDKFVIKKIINIDIDHNVSPTMNLVIFLKYDENITEIDSHIFKVDSCQNHDVIFEWSHATMDPGSPVNIEITAESSSLCGISVTDKSVNLLGKSNDVTQEKIDKLLQDIGQRKIPSTVDRCNGLSKILQSSGISILSDLPQFQRCPILKNGITLPRVSNNEKCKQGWIWNYNSRRCIIDANFRSHILDSSAFSISNDKYEDMSDDYRDDNEYYDEDVKKTKLQNPKVEFRNYFSETWLFQLNDTDFNGKLNINTNSPHSITEWQGEAFCINNQQGLGVAKPKSLSVDQDFFAEINLPYSIKRGEIVSLNISVFNKIQSQLPIYVQINADADNIKFENNHEEVCVEPRNSVVVPFKIEALRLGKHNLTASASITRGIPGCNNVAEGEGFTDALVRPLLVKPEGIPEEKVRTKLECSATRKTYKFKMSRMYLPRNYVTGSARGWIQITSDVMAPALQNIEKLVNLPTGCGEQNMIGLVPNIYLLQYLDATNKREPEIMEKAKTFMKIGYNRQQTYRHDDGSFSIWGTSKHNAHFRRGVDDGSTWLTAFVVKSFSMAAKYINIDGRLLQQSVDWLMGGQMENGCFSKSGYVHHKELAGGSSNASLTPFVFTALLEARSRLEVDLNEARLMKAMDCMLDNVNTSDAYTSVITAYAANRLVELEKQFSISEQMKERISLLWPHVLEMNPSTATRTIPRSVFQRSIHIPKTDAVEMTAYNLMTLLIQNKIPEASKVVKWLTKQRNSQGGFISTQDTVVAFQALSLYALKVPSNNLDMMVKIMEKNTKKHRKKHRNIETSFNLTQDNAQLLQTKKVTLLPNEVTIEMKGEGCVLVQSVLRYNVQEKRRNRGFDLAVFNQNDERIRVCAKYTGGKEQTNMVIAEVEMVTGWEVYRESLEELLNDVDSRVRKYEMQEKENKVVLYFDDIPKEEHCIEMEVKLVTLVEGAKHAIATIYDYYDVEETKSIKYLM